MDKNNLNPLGDIANLDDFDNDFDFTKNYYENVSIANNEAYNFEIDKNKSKTYGFRDAYRDAKVVNQLDVMLERKGKEKSFETVENYYVSSADLIRDGISNEYWDEFVGVTSPEEYAIVKKHLNEELEVRENLGGYGFWSGLGTEVLASVADPYQLAIGVATGGLGGFAKGASLMSKAAKAAKVGSIEGAIYGAVANNSSHTYEVKDWASDIAVSGLMSGAFTSVGHGLSKLRNGKPKTKAEVNAEEAYLKEINDMAANNEVVYNNVKMDESIKEGLDPTENLEQAWDAQIAGVEQKLAVEGDKYNNIITKMSEVMESDLPVGAKQKKYAKLERQLKKQDKKVNDLAADVSARRAELNDYLDLDAHDKYNIAATKMKELQIDNDLTPEDFTKYFEEGKDIKKFNPADGGSVGAARNVNDYDYTFDEKNGTQADFGEDSYDLGKVEGDGALNNANRKLSLIDTIQERLNKVGGSASILGDMVFHSVAKDKVDTRKLQAKYIQEDFENPNIAHITNEYKKYLSEAGGYNEAQAKKFAIMDAEGKSKEIPKNARKIAKRYNDTSRYFYDRHNHTNQLSAEIEKGHIAKNFMNKFYSSLEASQDGQLPLTVAFTNMIKRTEGKNKSVGRTFGSTEYAELMNNILYRYMEDPEQFRIDPQYKKYVDDAEFMASMEATDKSIQDLYYEMLKQMVESGAIEEGTPMYDLYSHRERYNPHNWSSSRMDDYQEKYGMNNIIDLFKRSLMSSVNDGAEKEAYFETVSTFLVENTIKRGRDKGITQLEMRMAFNDALNDFEGYIARMSKDDPEIANSPEVKQVKEFLAKTAESKGQKSGSNRKNQRRMKLNAYHTEKLLNNKTGKMEEVSIMDFLDTNVERQMQDYVNMSSSAIAFAKRGIKSKDQLLEMIQEVREQIHNYAKIFNGGTVEIENALNEARENIKTLDVDSEEYANAKDVIETTEDLLKDFTENELKYKTAFKISKGDQKFEKYEDAILSIWHGTSQIDMSDPINKNLQKIKSYNFARMMGKMTIAQAAELGEVMHMGGFSAMMQNMPKLKSVIGNINGMNGEDLSDLTTQFEQIGVLAENFNSQARNEMGESDTSLIHFDTNKYSSNRPETKYEKFDRLTSEGAYRTSRMAGFMGSKMDKFTKSLGIAVNLGQLDLMARKAVNENGLVELDWDTRNSGIGYKALNFDTLNHYGLEVSDLPDIKDAFDKYAIFKNKGKNGRRVIQGWDFEKMIKDQHPAFDNIRKFSIITTNEVVAPSTVGNSYHVLQNNMMLSVLAQFRGYMLQSFEHKIRSKFRRENNVVPYIAYMTFAGGISYTLNVLSNAPKYENSEEYIKDQLSGGKLLAGSFSRSTYAYLLPAILGQLESSITGTDYFGNSTRTTGLNQDLFSNPTFDAVNRVFGGATNLVEYASGQDPKGLEKAFRNGVSLLPTAALPVFGEVGKVYLKSGQTYETK